MQPTMIEGRSSIHYAGDQSTEKRPPPHSWIAIGERSTDCAFRTGRQVTDGVLLKLTVSIFGRQLVALVDSGASRCYISPEIVTSLGLKTSPALVHLELEDGSKIQSTQQVQGVRCTMGNLVCRLDFTVTKLLHQVDLVLRVNWLESWNVVIDWSKQTVNIWTGSQWEQLCSRLLGEEHQIGTVKIFTYMESVADHSMDFTILRQPKFWTYAASANAWTHSSEGDATIPVSTTNEASHNPLDPAPNAGNIDSNSSHSL